MHLLRLRQRQVPAVPIRKGTCTFDGLSIDALLVSRGYARASAAEGPYREFLASLEARAREERTGCLWGG